MSNGTGAGDSKGGVPGGTPVRTRQMAGTDWTPPPAGTPTEAMRPADPAVVRARTEPIGVRAMSGQPDAEADRLQRIMAEQTSGGMRVPAAPPASVQESRTDTPPIPPPPRVTEIGKTNERLGAVEDAVRAIRDELIPQLADRLDVLKEQLAGLSARMDAAGQKDDAHDGALTGLETGLKEAESDIKVAQAAADAAQRAADAAQAAADAAQKTGDAACRRLVEEYGEV